MPAFDFYRAQINCPHCRVTNTIATTALSPDTKVACSNCHGEIGYWRDVLSSSTVPQDQKEGRGRRLNIASE